VLLYTISSQKEIQKQKKDALLFLLPHFCRISPLDLGLELDEAAIYSGGLSFLWYGRKEDIYNPVYKANL